MLDGKKFKKPLKKRFKEEVDIEAPKNKKKHHDKTTWRLFRNEQKDKYGI